MNTKLEPQVGSGAADVAKYAVAVGLVLAGLLGYYFLSDLATPVRVVGLILSIVLAVAVFLLTAKGRDTKEFFAESRFELRKVVWPTREETQRTTLIIIVVVVLISLLLGLTDFLISSGVRFLLGA
jgi:preprotein translocase subunit SecE